MAAKDENEEFEFRLRAEKELKSAPVSQPETTPMQDVGQGLGNVAAGAVRGAGSIGATLIRPFETAAENEARRQAMDIGLQEMGAQPESLLYQGGKIAGEVAGTAGAGGVLARGAMAGAKLAPNLAPKVASALRSGGMQVGTPAGKIMSAEAAKNAALRLGGGAVTGGTMAGMVNPQDAGTGAVIGGAIPGVAAAAPSIGRGVANIIGGVGTHTGAESILQAARAGKQGGAAAQQFQENLRGAVPMTDVLETAKQNLQQMGAQKSAEYRAGMAKVSGDKSILDFSGIDKAMKDAHGMATFKGVVKNVDTAKALQDTFETINKWKRLKPSEYHTPEGLDALKQNIGGILESIPYEKKAARSAVGNVYNAVKNEINKQAPVYSKTMKGYSESSDQIKEIERALSLGDKASVDTAMRKLQSLTRSNVNTNFGNRVDLAKQLEQQGGQAIMPALAGQALGSWTPRGLGNAVAGGLGLGGYAVGGGALAAPILAAQSPRLMGEAAYYAGKGSNVLSDIAMSPAARAALIAGAQNQ